MAAIPKTLSAYGEILKGAESLKQITVENVKLLPNNQPSSQVYAPESTNSIYFRVPNFSNSFLNTQESFLQFDFKIAVGSASLTDSLGLKLADWCPLFNRIVVKTSNGLIIQDTSNAHILSKLINLMSTEPHAKTSEADYSDFNITDAKGKVGQLQKGKLLGGGIVKPVTYVMRFNHGVLNAMQALPIGLMGTSFALDIELYLASPQQCLETIGDTSAFTIRSYQLSNVSYNMTLLRLSEDLMRKYNMIMNSDQELVLPITVMKSFVSSQNSISQSHFFHESSTDIRKMFTVFTHNTDIFLNSTNEPSAFHGAVNSAVDALKLTEYSVKVGNHNIYNEPVREIASNSVSLSHLKNCTSNKQGAMMKVEKTKPNKFTNYYETGRDFIIAASFIYSNDDNISQGISLSGNPIVLNTTFKTQTSLRVNTFLECGFNMHISKGEVTLHEVDLTRQSY